MTVRILLEMSEARAITRDKNGIIILWKNCIPEYEDDSWNSEESSSSFLIIDDFFNIVDPEWYRLSPQKSLIIKLNNCPICGKRDFYYDRDALGENNENREFIICRVCSTRMQEKYWNNVEMKKE